MDRFKKFHFAGQKDQEEILMVVHRHWFNIAQQMFWILVLLSMLFGSIVYLPVIFRIFNFQVTEKIMVFFETGFAMMIWMMFFLIWIDYYFDVWIITNLRIVNIEQRGLFVRAVSEMEFSKIQDITTEVAGIIPTFMNFGDVLVQTAAETERFLFRKVPDPYRIKDQIMKLQKQRATEKTEEFRKIMDGEGL